MEPINRNWTDENGLHQGGVSTGVRYTIAWQRGPLNEAGRNGALLIEVLESCRGQLKYFQNSKFASPRNEEALYHLDSAIAALKIRLDERAIRGILGTHKV